MMATMLGYKIVLMRKWVVEEGMPVGLVTSPTYLKIPHSREVIPDRESHICH